MPLKLSEAIRLGSMLGPQTFGHVYWRDRTCAMGAAYRALGLSMKIGIRYPSLCRRLPIVRIVNTTPCPACGHTPIDPANSGTIVHLNDYHRWTREAIADFVEQIERLQEPTSQPASRDWIGSVTS